MDDKAHEITRLKEQSENLRTLVDDANRGSLARAEELRKDLEAKAAQMEVCMFACMYNMSTRLYL